MDMNALIWAESIVTLINGIQKSIYNVYYLLLTIGHLAISAILEIFRFCNNIVTTSVQVSNVLREDFEIFKYDLYVLCSPLRNWVTEVIMNSIKVLNQAYAHILSSCTYFIGGIQLLSYVCQWLKEWSEDTCILIINSLSLIGNVFICCVDFLRDILSLATLTDFGRKVTDDFVNKVSYILRQEALFGLFVVSCLTAISVKSKIHLKIVKQTKILLHKLAIGSQHGCKLILMVFPTLIVIMRRTWKNTRQNLHKFVRKKTNFIQPSQDDLQRLLEQEKAEKLCVICMDRKRNIMLMDCQHLILCSTCVHAILCDSALCPVCRSDIRGIMSVYT